MAGKNVLFDEEEDEDEYEIDGFIVDDEDGLEEDMADSDDEKQKKKNGKKREAESSYVRDEDDYELLHENNITSRHPELESEKFKRLKKAQRDTEEELFGLSDEEFDGSGKGGQTAKEALNRSLFGDDEGPTLEDIAEEEQPHADFVEEDPDIVLSEKYTTEKDNQIPEIDVPERIQISEQSTGPPPTDAMSIEEESNWIYNQLATSMAPLFGRREIRTTEEGIQLSINKDDIMRFLDMMHVQKLDVPFIAIYRKEECLSLLKDPNPEQHEADDENQNKDDQKPSLNWHKVLWAIQDLDRKWLLLQKRKSALLAYYHKCYEEESHRIYDKPQLNLYQQLFGSITKSLKEAESEREVDDVDSKFNLYFPPGEIDVDEGQYKRPKRKSQYSICSRAGLWEVAGKFGYSSEQFGLQISLEKMKLNELEDANETPEEMASSFTCAMFETPQAVLKGARHMVAVEISCEPSVRKHVRSIFMDNAIVSTSPTPDGNVAIDSLHQYAGVKWLRDKPLTRFEDAQWLFIQKAEEEKLLQVTIKLPETVLDKLISDSNVYYLSDGVSKSAQLWNEQRKLILQDAFFGFLLSSMEKEARSLLTSRAKNWLLLEYGKILWDKVSLAPYQRKESDEAAPRVMACCWGPGKPATTFVMLDASGELLDVLYAGSLSLRGQNVNDQQRKKNDQQRVYKFMTDHQPQVVVLGAVNLSCTRLKEDIFEIIFKMVEDNSRDVGHEMDNLSIIYGNESLPHIYENCRISSDQLPGQSGIVKRAVALGRYVQNPLAMVATLCGPGREILSWKLSPLESFAIPDERYGIVEQVMVDVINQVGLDVNLAASHEWLFAPLQFIAGLGPRKAASLQRSLVRAGAIFTRKDLLTAHGLGKKVFVNAVGFLCVRRSGLASSGSQFLDLLDDTRIHPECYGLAQELAKYAYIEDVQDDPNDDEDVLEMAIEHVKEKPDFLKSLEVDEYAKSKNREDKKETLRDIRLELIKGFQDWRRPYEEPSPDEEFYMISGETEDTLPEGRIVQATVRRVQPERAVCVLESGLTGMLMKEDYTDEWRDIDDLTEKLHEGDILTCRIKSIQKNRYQVFLNCKQSAMRVKRYQNHQSIDPYYHEEHSSLQSERDKAHKNKELAKKHFKPRMILHPHFQNITADEAMELLSDGDPGESVIRPSSRGPSFLTLTLKVYDGVYAHKDIVEGGKELKDITSLLQIGKTLRIGEDTFGDLDAVMDRYVNPLVAHLKAMLSFHKFRKGTKAEVDELLKIEKSENPMRIVYCFGIAHEHPGTFILTYIRSTNTRHEYVGLYPKGFKFRKTMFQDIDPLVSYFQRHIDDPRASGGSSGGWDGSSNSDGGGGRGRGRGRGQGRGRGRGSYNGGRSDSDRQDSDYSSQKWDSKEGDDGWRSFPGSKVQNSPGMEASPGRWGGGGSDSAAGSGWGGGGSSSAAGSGWGGGGNDRGSSGWGSRNNEDVHESGVPRPYGGRGRGRGRGRDSYNGGRGDSDRQDSDYSSQKWGSKEGDDGWRSFPGSKIQNSPGKEASPDGWGGGGSDSAAGGGWGGGGSSSAAGSGWGGGGGNDGGGSGWGSRNNKDGHQSGRGCGRGRDSYNGGRGDTNGNDRQDSGYISQKWGSKEGEDGWGSFPDAKVQNSPGKEASSGGWGGSGSGSAVGSGWGGGVSGSAASRGGGGSGSAAGSGWGGGGSSSDAGSGGGNGGGSSGWGGHSDTGTTDMGNSSWGGSKKSSVKSQAGSGGWSGSGGGGGGGW